MPSNAWKSFNQNSEDIDNLIDLYRGVVELWEDADDPAPVPDGYDVLFRSAVVYLVTYWEAYIEDICSEALDHLVKHVTEAEKLPKEIKKQVAGELKASKNEIDVWLLADNGWRQHLAKRLPAMREARERSFNTPKAQNTADFVRKVLGIDNIRTSWGFDRITPEVASKKLDDLVEVRGQIAHRGRVEHRLDEKYIEEHVAFLRKIASQTGGRINAHVKNITGKPLWELKKANKPLHPTLGSGALRRPSAG